MVNAGFLRSVRTGNERSRASIGTLAVRKMGSGFGGGSDPRMPSIRRSGARSSQTLAKTPLRNRPDSTARAVLGRAVRFRTAQPPPSPTFFRAALAAEAVRALRLLG